MNHFPGRLAVQQRVLPNYRASFFDLLASACEGGMSLFTGLPRKSEGITTANELRITNYQLGKNVHLFSGPLYLCYQRGLIDWLESWNPDALVVEANPRYLSTPSAVKWMHERKKPVIGWGLGAPRFDFAIAPLSASKTPTAKPDRRPLTVDRFTILFVGRLQARKRIDSLLRACAQIDSKPRLVIVGDGPERKRYEKLAKQLYPSAEFVGAKYGAELKPYFMEADLFVLPGTGGLAVQEAMSYGLPVIVAQGDGTQDDLVRPENGWQIPPDQVHYLIYTMQNALSDVARLRKMGEESYRIVKEEINIEKMVETFVRALNQLTFK